MLEASELDPPGLLTLEFFQHKQLGRDLGADPELVGWISYFI